MKKLVLAGAFLSVLGLAGAAPAEANGWERGRSVDKRETFHRFSPERHDGAKPSHHRGTSVAHRGRPYAGHRRGSVLWPVVRVRRVHPAASLVSRPVGYVGLGYAEPAWSVVTTTYSLAPLSPICGSYAAPIGEHGVVYNRPLCPYE